MTVVTRCWQSEIMIILLSPADSVYIVPEVKLENWAIQEIQSLEGLTYHFVGFIDGQGRISTPIAEWHTESKVGRTASGRLYELIGPPGDESHFELKALCGACAVRYGAISIRDVTKDFVGWRH